MKKEKKTLQDTIRDQSNKLDKMGQTIKESEESKLEIEKEHQQTMEQYKVCM